MEFLDQHGQLATSMRAVQGQPFKFTLVIPAAEVEDGDLYEVTPQGTTNLIAFDGGFMRDVPTGSQGAGEKRFVFESPAGFSLSGSYEMQIHRQRATGGSSELVGSFRVDVDVVGTILVPPGTSVTPNTTVTSGPNPVINVAPVITVNVPQPAPVPAPVPAPAVAPALPPPAPPPTNPTPPTVGRFEKLSVLLWIVGLSAVIIFLARSFFEREQDTTTMLLRTMANAAPSSASITTSAGAIVVNPQCKEHCDFNGTVNASPSAPASTKATP